MRSEDVAALLVIGIVAAILIFYFLSARGPSRQVTIANPDGSKASVSAEVADNPFTRAKGLMGRASLGEDEGMLFVFGSPGNHSFWMFNTTIPLDGIFIAENGTIVDVVPMQPCGLNVTNCPSYVAKAPAKYVLEANQGFAKRHGIVIGKSRMSLP
ncbi:MAG: DUF192 domain-containing protein [Candidatus ainarchaeum sp.]|nr:DUF192 domain-containing protein [Candidatus ainarchaeum sp.]